MQAQRNNESERTAPGQEARGHRYKLLFVGRANATKGNAVRRLFNARKVQVIGELTSLPEALRFLEAHTVDAVLVGSEFREEEVSLFVRNAQGCGFAGFILRIIPTPAQLTLSGPRGKDSSARNPDAGRREDRPRQKVMDLTGNRRRVQIQRAIPPTQEGPQFHGPYVPASLTTRQQIVFERVYDGWTSKQIARSLKCSEGSVKAVLQQLFRKLGVRKRALMTRMAAERTLTNLYGGEGSGIQVAQAPNPVYQPADRDEPPAKVAPKTGVTKKKTIRAGDFVIDVPNQRVWVRGAEVLFAPAEFKLLTYFGEHPEELVRHQSLLKMLCGNPAAAREPLRVLICALRTKIETTETPRYIVTQRTFGYRFVPSPPANS